MFLRSFVILGFLLLHPTAAAAVSGSAPVAATPGQAGEAASAPSAIPAPDLSTIIDLPSLLVGEPGQDGLAEARMQSRELTRNADWPRVDSIQVVTPFVNFESDSARIIVYVTNPIQGHTFDWRLWLKVFQEAAGYEHSFSPVNVNLPPGVQRQVEFVWHDPDAPWSLSFEAEAHLMVDSRGNAVVNGDFESGLSGWTVQNNNPPGYGVETVTTGDGDPDREAHVYSTFYNTYGIQPKLMQRVYIDGDCDTSVYFRMKMTTEDGWYGIGLGIVAIKTDRGGYYYLWHSTQAKPNDTSTEKYVQHYGSSWGEWGVALSQIPQGVNEYIEIWALAALIPMGPYGSAETDIYLDDVYVSCDDPTTLGFSDQLVNCTLETVYVGNLQEALDDCLTPRLAGSGVTDAVPFLCGINIAQKVMGNMCAAAIYQTVGDDFQSGVYAARSFYGIVECPFKSLYFAAGVGHMTSAASEAGMWLLNTLESFTDLMVGAPSWEVAFRSYTDTFVAIGAAGEVLPPLAGVAASVLGEMYISVLGRDRQETGVCSADSVGMTRSWVLPIPSENLTVAEVGMDALVMETQELVDQGDLLRFRIEATGDGPCSLAVAHVTTEGPVQVRPEPVELSAGDVVWIDLEVLPEPGRQVYELQVDYGGDGVVDLTIPAEALPVEVYACCVDGVCVLQTESNCAALGGEYHPGLTCDPDPCGGVVSEFVRGDVDGSGEVDISDPIFNLSYQFAGGDAPGCLDAADDDDSGEIDISDPIYSLNYQFSGGDPFPAPFPSCGLDPTPDALDCAVYSNCRGEESLSGGHEPAQEVDGLPVIRIGPPQTLADGCLAYSVDVITSRSMLGLEFRARIDSGLLVFDRVMAEADYDFLSGRWDPVTSSVRVGLVPDLGLLEPLPAGETRIGSLVFRPDRTAPGTPSSQAGPNPALWSVVAVDQDGAVLRSGELATAFTQEDAGRLEDAIVCPNPFRPGATVSLMLGSSGHASVDVFDVSGRRVRGMWDGTLQAGLAGWVWDGRGDEGEDLAAGVYWVRATVPSGTLTRKIVLRR